MISCCYLSALFLPSEKSRNRAASRFLELLRDLDRVCSGRLNEAALSYMLWHPQRKGIIMDSITVKVGKLPGRINEFALGADATIQDALNVAELDPSGYEVRVDGELIDQLGDSLEDGSSVLLSRKIKGN